MTNKTETLEKAEQQAAEPRYQRVTPYTDLFEKDDAFILAINVPGVELKDIKVHLEDNELSISANSSLPSVSEYKQLHQEYVPRKYERAFLLRTEIDPEGIDAKLKNGVLTLVLPKTKAVQPRHVNIKAG